MAIIRFRQEARRRARRSWRNGWMRGAAFPLAGALGFVLVLGAQSVPVSDWLDGIANRITPLPETIGQVPATRFPICGSGRRVTCVVDGDTFWYAGERIRIADIDAPEIGTPQCAAEAERGARATTRLAELLNAGAFTLARQGARDADQYGRSLRVVLRDGQSLGGQLVNEGLARAWDGARRSWC